MSAPTRTKKVTRKEKYKDTLITAYANIAALVEAMDLFKIYGDFGFEHMNESDMKKAQDEVVFHLRNCGRRYP